MSVFVPNKPAIRHLLRGPGGLVGNHITKLAFQTYMLAKAQVGVDTGALKDSIHFNVKFGAGPVSARIGSSNSIALLHHEGTKPHIIKPKNAKALVFQSRGKIVYTKIVRHPGTKPNKYLTDSLKAVIS